MPPGQEYLHVIAQLRTLRDSDRKASRKVNKLLDLAPWFLVSHVGRHIRANPEKIQEILCQAQDHSHLEDQQF